MSDHDLLVETVEAIYASGVDTGGMPAALEATNRLLDAAGATIIVFDKAANRLTDLCAVGAAAHAKTPYFEQFARVNPRLPYALRQPPGHIIWDYQIVDETEIARNPFYAEFLQSLGLRYVIGTVLERTADKLVAVSIHRTAKQGHVDRHEITLFQKLGPHLQRAYDMASRLKAVGIREHTLENTLDWLTDGVALLRADNYIVYANEAFCALARHSNGFRITENTIEFTTPEVRRHFTAALNTVGRVCDNPFDTYPTDFPVSRDDGLPAYTVALRPLVRLQAHALQHTNATVMMLIHDPLARNVATSQLLQTMFNLTGAEANLAQALCAGMTTNAYASTRRVTLNTVYTHLRRIREKTSCNSIAELVRRLGELSVSLRLSR